MTLLTLVVLSACGPPPEPPIEDCAWAAPSAEAVLPAAPTGWTLDGGPEPAGCTGEERVRSTACAAQTARYRAAASGADAEIRVTLQRHTGLDADSAAGVGRRFGQAGVIPQTLDGHSVYTVHTSSGSYWYWLSGDTEVELGMALMCHPELIRGARSATADQQASSAALGASCHELGCAARAMLRRFPSGL